MTHMLNKTDNKSGLSAMRQTFPFKIYLIYM